MLRQVRGTMQSPASVPFSARRRVAGRNSESGRAGDALHVCRGSRSHPGPIPETQTPRRTRTEVEAVTPDPGDAGPILGLILCAGGLERATAALSSRIRWAGTGQPGAGESRNCRTVRSSGRSVLLSAHDEVHRRVGDVDENRQGAGSDPDVCPGRVVGVRVVSSGVGIVILTCSSGQFDARGRGSSVTARKPTPDGQSAGRMRGLSTPTPARALERSAHARVPLNGAHAGALERRTRGCP